MGLDSRQPCRDSLLGVELFGLYMLGRGWESRSFGIGTGVIRRGYTSAREQQQFDLTTGMVTFEKLNPQRPNASGQTM